MAEEYSRLRGRLRKFKRERADLEAQIEVLKQTKDLSTMAGSEEISQNTVKEADRKVEQKSPTNEEKETNSNVKEEHHEKSLMAEVLKLKVVYFVRGDFFPFVPSVIPFFFMSPLSLLRAENRLKICYFNY